MAQTKSVWWCGWEVPFDLPTDDMLEAWPVGMRGWRSGESDSRAIWVGRVEATSAEAAEAVVRSCYGAHAEVIEMRWEPKRHEAGWWPEGSRFPR